LRSAFAQASADKAWEGCVDGERVEEEAEGSATVDPLAGEEGLCVRPSKYRDMQVARKGKRKLFDKKRRKIFLEWLRRRGIACSPRPRRESATRRCGSTG